MKRPALVVAGAIGGLVVGLMLSLLVQEVVAALGLDDPNVGEGTSLSGAFGLLVLSASIVAGATLGYKTGSPGPDPTELRRSKGYFNWIRGYRDSETGSSSAQERRTGPRA